MRDQIILFLGYGYVAKAVARRLRAAGWRARATWRREEQAADLAADGVAGVPWRDGKIDLSAFESVDAILVSTPPGERGCPALAAAREALGGRLPKWVGYLSTNGVYGDHGGAVVDETSPLLATSPRGRARIDAENAWRDYAYTHGFLLVIFRLPGIYGPGRSAFDQIRDGRAQRIYKPGQVFRPQRR